MASKAENTPEAPEEKSDYSAIDNAIEWSAKTFGQMDRWSIAGGAALMIALLALANPIGQSNSFSVLDHSLSPVFVTGYVALSAGHYLGLAVTGNDSNFIDGILGMFIVLSVAVIGWGIHSGIFEIPIALTGIIFGLVIAHHRGWVQENEYLNIFVEILGRGIVPSGLVGGAIVEILIPIIQALQVHERFLALNFDSKIALALLFAGIIYVLGKAVEAKYDTSERTR